MKTLPDIYALKIDAIILKVQQEFTLFEEYSYNENFILQEEKDYILSCEKLIIYYLKRIKNKILTGQMKPWMTSGDVKISIFSGTCDYPTMAHLLLMLDNLADKNISSDFLIIFLETDENNKPDKSNNFDTRERLVKILTEPFGELIRYVNYGKDLKYFEVICKLMNKDYPLASEWTQIIGSDVFKKFKTKFVSEVNYWKEIFHNKQLSTKDLQFNYCLYNRGEKSSFITTENLRDYSEKYNVSVLLKTSPLDRYLYKFTKNKNVFLSATTFKKSLLRVAYPSIINVLYAGYQLVSK
jgi:nicotinic acid mononucleotide adenylyltransferase